MWLKAKNNLQFNILTIEIEIKDYYGLKINSIIQIHLLTHQILYILKQIKA
jgi:hypothetical protein